MSDQKPTGSCVRCGRELSDPISVAAGIGPVCAAERAFIDSIQGNLFTMHTPNYAIVDENEKRILIKDLGPWDKHPTITNGAELVVAELADRLNGRELHYIDSEGVTDALMVKDGRFAGFGFLGSAP